MIPLTATIIALDEEANIAECLRSVAWVPHIVVLDSGSRDRTVEIARQFTPLVECTDWPGHVAQKNRAVDRAPSDWILSIDADERVTPELRACIEDRLRTEPEAAGFSVRRKTHYLGRWFEHSGFYPDRKVRIFDRRRARWGGVNPHDRVQVQGRVEALECDLQHYSYRSIEDHLRTIDSFTSIDAAAKDASGRTSRALRIALKPPGKFLKMYLFQQGFRDGFPGFIAAGLGSLYVLLKEAKLWERGRLRARGFDPDALARFSRGPEYRPPRTGAAAR